MSALKNVVLNDNKTTSQTEQADERQSKNNAGGYSFTVTDKDRFRRFLTIGSESGTYYVGEKKLTDDNVKFVKDYIASAGVEAVREIVEVSSGGLAPKNDQAIFALAVAINADDAETKQAAKEHVVNVCRTATHLFMFIGFLKNVGGMGRAKTSAIASFYESKSSEKLGYQMVKYRQREGYTHRDALRLAHPRGLNENIVNFALGKDYDLTQVPHIIQAFVFLQDAKTEDDVVKLIHRYENVSWEMIPTEFHKSVKVWKTLFESGIPQTALLRNITRFARLGMFNDMKFVADVAAQLSDKDRIEKSRIHPIQYLNAMVVHKEGQKDRLYGYSRNKDWETNSKILAALDEGYRKAFKNLVPANKRTLVAVDVSGSMGAPAAGIDLSCAQVSAAMASFIAASEPYSIIRGFSSGERDRNRWGSMNHSKLIDLGISESDSFNDVMRKTSSHNFGRTDCALPMVDALEQKIEVDTFIILTDSETWAGNVHPHEALTQYNKKMGRNAKLIVVAATATEFTIGDPDRPDLYLDVSGFDSSTPKVIADFSAGRI